MPQILSLVGKALGSILRGSGSNDYASRNRNSIDSDGGFNGSRWGRESAAEAPPASESCSRQRSKGQEECLGNLVAPIRQSADLFSAVDRDAGPTMANVSSSDRAPDSRNSSAGGASASAACNALVPVHYVSSEASLPGSSSPPAATQFFRASRASLSDSTSAGEALRQASVTTCKHFSRENYNNYVRWVRASRGAIKLGKLRQREVINRNPHPTLLLRCEHWLEVTDEQHRYGSNLRVYFDYWVAEMEAAELTPPQSPALMSPSPSYSQLVALAQQQQQLQIASAIANAAAAERISPIQNDQRYNFRQQQHEQRSSISAPNVDFQAPTPYQRPLPPIPQQQPAGLSGGAQQEQQGPAPAGPCAGCNQGSSSPGPSRFSNDANPVSSASEYRSYESAQRQVDEAPQLQCKPNCSEGRSHNLSHPLQHNCHHQQHKASVALACDGPGPQVGESELFAAGTGTGRNALSSKISHTRDGASQQAQEQQDGEGQQSYGSSKAHHHHHHNQQQHYHHSRRNHHHDLDQELYDCEGSVRHGTDDGGRDSLTVSISATRSHDGEDDVRGPIQPHSPADTTDVTTACGRDAPPVRCVAGSCEPPLTLLHRNQLQQQRRRSCGESEIPAVRHTVVPQPRASSDAITVMTGPTMTPMAVAPPSQPHPGCGSPRRNVLCSPSRRFVLAAMIDMSPAENQTSEMPLVDGDQQGTQQEQENAALTTGGLLSRQLQQDKFSGGGSATAATAPSAEPCRSCGADGSTASPATPQYQHQQQWQLQEGTGSTPSLPPATPALTSFGGASGGGSALGVSTGCAAQRAAKLLSNRACVGSGTSFFRWLDFGPGLDVNLAHLGVPRAKLDAERVKYLTLEELLEYELDIDLETGLLRYKRSGKLLHTGPDGRGSLDEHRRPPTPPPLAIPLSLLGESASAWWRGSSATGPLELLPGLQSSSFQAAGAPSHPLLPPPPPPLPPRNHAAVARQAFRRMGAMGTVMEGSSGDGGSCCSLGEATGQQPLAGDAAIEAAAAAAVLAEAEPQDKLEDFSGHVPAAKAVGGGLLPDLGLRGHSASSLARLEPLGPQCFSSKVDIRAPVARSDSNTGDISGKSWPCSSTGPGIMVTGTATTAAGLSTSAGEADPNAGCRASSASEALQDNYATNNRTTFAGFGDLAASVTQGLLDRSPEPLSASNLSPDVTSGARAETSKQDVVAESASVAVAAEAGSGGSPKADDITAAGSMPKTPVASQAPGGGGGGHNHDGKVAKWIYVVDPELRLFVHPKVRGRFHHSSFLRGGAVVAAGGLAARHGRLRLLTADSGHYWPREENFRWLCEHLVYVGADLSACELRSKHMNVPAGTGKELMEKMGVPPPWRAHYHQSLSPSAQASLEQAPEMDAPPSPLTQNMRMLQMHE